jgi:acyl-CoA thioesterase-1|tara:strand:+ start:51 stop:656 length:606 start_codon:yes stop_codon:yes gene_type:complete
MKKIVYILIFLISPLSLQAQDYKIILFGDSLMAGYGLDSADHLNLYLEKDLLSLNIQSSITNASVSGDTTSGGLNRLNWSLQDDYDLFVLGLGANDMLRGIAPEITKTNLSKIIDTVLDKDIKLLLTGMKAPNSYGSDYQQSFNDIYPNLAEEFKISFYPFLLEGVALIPELNQSDGKHPNREGIQIISKNLANTIKSIIN